jgi:isopenicillin N synthase-like dioxygenase
MEAGKMSEQTIPLVDIEPFLKGGAADKAAVAGKIDQACREIGFLVIAGHGVSPQLIADMHEISHGYFALPYWEKMFRKMPPDRYRGYTAPGDESLALSLDQETPPDLKESFSLGPFDVEHDEYHFGAAGERFFAANVWPDRPARMRGLWETYYSEMERLGADLMRVFAVALGLDEAWFQDKIDRQIANFSVIHYPGQKEAPRAGQLRGGAHTDYGSLTIVQTDTDVGGLEVLRHDGDWLAVPWMPGTFAVNIGDLMAEWTNDIWVSTLHRVANPPRDKAGESKTSLLFFQQPNYDAVVECIPTCCGADRPAKYGRTTSGEHVTQKVMKHRHQMMGSAAE